MPGTVDKNVTIRLEATDGLSPVLRRAAAEADRLAASAAKTSSAVASMATPKGAGLSQVAEQSTRAATSLGTATAASNRLASSVERIGSRIGPSMENATAKTLAFGAALGKPTQSLQRLQAAGGARISSLAADFDKAGKAAEAASAKYEAFGRAGRTAAVVSGGAAIGLGAMVKTYADFDSTMSKVAASTQTTGAALDRMRTLAIDAGADTQYSAKEAADGINEMAKAGVSTADILNGGLRGALALASSGQMDVAEAAETASAAMVQFNLGGEKVGHVADLLAAGAGKAMGSVHDMGMALNQSGLIAHQTGLSIEETVGGLAAFASAGLVGSDAGTSFKTMLQRLNPTTKEAQQEMQLLGISAYDQNGNFAGLANVAGQLQEKMGGLSAEQRNAAMATIFGSDAVRAASVLYEQGATGIQKWIDKVNDQGYAMKLAGDYTNNLAGDWEKLTGQWDSTVIKSGSGVNQMLRGIVQGAESTLTAVGSLPAPLLQTGAVMGTVATAAAAVGTAAMVAVPKWVAFRAALATIPGAAGKATVALRALGGAAALVGVAASYDSMADSLAKVGRTTQGVDELGQSMINLAHGTGETKAFTDMLAPQWDLQARAAGLFGHQIRDTGGALQTFGLEAKAFANDGFMDKVLGFGTQQASSGSFKADVEQLDGALAKLAMNGHADEAAQAYQRLMTQVKTSGGDVDKTAALFTQYQAAVQAAATANDKESEAARRTAAAAKGMSLAQYDAAKSMEDAAEQAKEAKEATDGYRTAIGALNEALLGQQGSVRAYEAAIDEADAAVRKNGQTLDITTEAGRANAAALEAIATSGAAAAQKTLENGGSVQTAANMYDVARAKYIETATAMGMTKPAAEKAADALGLTGQAAVDLAIKYGQVGTAAGEIPPFIQTKVQLDGYEAVKAQLGDIGAAMVFDPPPIMLNAPVIGPVIGAFSTVQQAAATLGAMTPTPTVSQKGAEPTTSAMQDVIDRANTLAGQKPTPKVSEKGARETGQKLDEVTGKARTLDAQHPTVTVGVSGAQQAMNEIDAVIRRGKQLDGQTFRAVATLGDPFAPVNRARGGPIVGPGTATSDSIPAWLSNGEHVLTAREVAAAGGHAAIMRLRSALLSGSAPRFAEGGPVRRYATGGKVVTPKGPTVNVSGLASSGWTIPVTARVTKVTIPKGVEAPFLYTPGGKWDRSGTIPEVALSKISDLFKKTYVSPTQLAEARSKVVEAGGSVGSVSTGSARAAGKAAGSKVAAANAAFTTGMREQVAAKTSPDSARAAAIANALSMNGRGSYHWGGGHSDTYYKNSAALAADCSGFVGWAIGHAIGKNATGVTTTMLTNNKSLGYVKIDPRIAAKTAGAIMGNAGHVVMSLGDGRVIESYQTGKPVRIRAVSSRDMKMAAWNTALGPMTQGTAAQVTGGLTGASTVGGSATDVKNLAQAQAEYAKALAASKIPASVQFARATVNATKVSAQFLGNIRKIRNRGFPEVAARILMMGEEDGAAVAASFASGDAKTLRNEQANLKSNAAYESMRKDLEASLSAYKGPPAWITAVQDNVRSNTKTKQFLADIKQLQTMGYGTLAAKLLDMGIDDGYDLARQAVGLDAKGIRNLRDTVADQPRELQRQQDALTKRATITTATASTAKFIADIKKIRDSGYPQLALKLMELGESEGGAMASEAAKASTADMAKLQSDLTASEAIGKQAQSLLDQLRGVGQVLNVSVGQSTGSDPAIRYTAARPIDARPAPVQYLVGPQGGTTGASAPLVHVEHMHAASPADAASQMETRLGDAVAVAGVGRVI